MEMHFRGVFAASLALLLVGCGGSSSTPPAPHPAKRVLLSNPLGSAVLNTNVSPPIPVAGTGAVDIIDAVADKFLSTSLPASDLFPALHLNVPGAGGMATGGGVTAVANDSQNTITLIDNSKQQVIQTPGLPERAHDVAMSPDGKTAYVAIRNAGALGIVNTADGSLISLPVPTISRLVLSPGGSRLLAFSDDTQSLPPPDTSAFFVIDTVSKNVAPVTVAGLDHPFSGVFDNSETRAFILDCGAECGGNRASVTRVDFSGPLNILASVPVSGATVGLLSGRNLYVAGTDPQSSAGILQAIDTSSMTALPPVSITAGHHFKMKLASNNRLYIGAIDCTPANDPSTGLIRGCLTIFDANTGRPVFPRFPSLRQGFDVTAIQPITERPVVYVCEGGELDIFDTTTDGFTANQIDVVGKAVDVVQIDPLW